MALVNVVCYRSALIQSGVATQVPLAPPVSSEQIDTTADGTSSAIPAICSLIEVTAAAAVYMAVLRAPGTADADDILIPANIPRFFGIASDGGWYLEFTAV